MSSVMLFAFYPSNSKMSGTTIATITILHAAIFLLSAMLIALPKPSPRNMGIGIFIGFSLVVNTWVALACVLLQFVPQYFEMRRMDGESGALSLASLALQAVVMLALARRWLLRLGEAPSELGLRKMPWQLWWDWSREWYQWGQLPFSCFVYGFGCAVLVGAYFVTD